MEICMASAGITLLIVFCVMWDRECARREPKVTWIEPEEQDEGKE